MTDLFDISLAVIRELGAGIESVATAGAIGSITDATYLKNEFKDDTFNKGTVWVWSNADDAGAAPAGEYQQVSDFVESTGVLTLAANLTAAVEVSDKFVVSRKTYRLSQIIAMLNRVLQGLRIPKVDESVSTAAEQLEYTLPTTYKGSDDDLEVWMQGKTDDANANYWFQVYDWYIKHTSTGTAKTLVFLSQPAYVRELSLRWEVPHAAVYDYDDEIDEDVSIDRLTYLTAIELLTWRKRQPGVKSDAIDEHIAELNVKLIQEEWRRPVEDNIKMATLGEVDHPVYMEDN